MRPVPVNGGPCGADRPHVVARGTPHGGQLVARARRRARPRRAVPVKRGARHADGPDVVGGRSPDGVELRTGAAAGGRPCRAVPVQDCSRAPTAQTSAPELPQTPARSSAAPVAITDHDGAGPVERGAVRPDRPHVARAGAPRGGERHGGDGGRGPTRAVPVGDRAAVADRPRVARARGPPARAACSRRGPRRDQSRPSPCRMVPPTPTNHRSVGPLPKAA